jgi:transposase
MKKQHLELTKTQEEELEQLLAKGEMPVRLFKRATGLLALNRGETLEAVAALLGVTNDTVRAWRKAYQAEGLKGLSDKPRSGRPVEIDGQQRAQITALACSEAPPGHSQWSLRLLAEKVVEVGYCESISHTQVGAILKKRIEAPSEKDVVSGATHARLSGPDGAAFMALWLAL